MIPTWGTSTGRNSAGGIPSLLLDFSNQSYLLNGTAFAAFGGSPGITFSRGTNATLIDNTGLLTYAPSNQFLNSESLGGAGWSPTNLNATTPVVSNTIAAPDGTITADKIVEDNTVNAHLLNQITAFTASVSYTASIYAKAAERQYVQIVLTATAFGAAKTAGFDLSGSGTTVTSAGTTSSITSVGNGWYRCSITATATISTSAGTQIRIADSLSATPASYQGVVTSGLYLWGAQVGAVTYETAPRPYNSTTPKNLLGFTEEFDNAAWGKTLATVTPNSIADPNGNLNADTLSATLGNATILQNISLLAVPYTFSIWLKRKTGTGNINITINGVTFITQAVTADWARFSTTLTPSAGTKNIGVQIVTLGDEVYAWGAQLSDSASLDPYVYNPAAAPTSTAYYGPRVYYDPATLNPLGLLIEEARTNLSLQSQTLNVSPWVLVNATIVSNVISAPDGTLTADFLKEDLTIIATTHNIDQFVPTTSTLYTTSIYAKAGTRSKILFAGGGFAGQGFVAIFDLINGTMFSNIGNKGTIINAGNGWYRCIITFTTTNTNIFNWYMCDSSNTNNYIGDGTSGLYLWGAQTEAAGFVTSYIPTVAASATRSADVATMVGNNFTNWYNPLEGSFTVSADSTRPVSTSPSTRIIQFDDGTNSNNIRAAGASTLQVIDAGTTQASLGPTPFIVFDGTTFKFASAFKENDFASVTTGVVATDTSGTIPTVTQLCLGYGGTGGILGGHLKAISYFNSRLTNAQLQALTA